MENEYNKLINKEFEKFDIDRFNKNKDEAEDYLYVLNNGTKIMNMEIARADILLKKHLRIHCLLYLKVFTLI